MSTMRGVAWHIKQHKNGTDVVWGRGRRYDTRCYFNVRSKADISQLNLPQGLLSPCKGEAFPLPPSPHLRSRALTPSMVSGGALCAPPAGCGAEPQQKSNLVHVSF